MSQVTIYINNNLEEKIKKVAQSMNMSISKFIANTVEQQLKEEWPDSIKQFSGSWNDMCDASELRENQVKDVERESF